MDKNRFFEALQNPATLEKLYFVDIQEVVKEFPYFNAAYLLLARRAKDVYRTDWQEILAKAATFLPNRTKLFEFLNTFNSPAQTTTVAPQPNSDQLPTNQNNDTDNTIALSTQVLQNVLNNTPTPPLPQTPDHIETITIGVNTSSIPNPNDLNDISAPDDEDEALSALLKKIKETENPPQKYDSNTPANPEPETIALPLLPSTSVALPQTNFYDEDQQLLDTDEIEEQAIKEVQQLLQHKEQLKSLITDAPTIEQKEQEITKWIKKDVQNEFENLKKEVVKTPQVNDPTPEMHQQTNIEQDDLIETLRKKIEIHQKTTPPPTPQAIPNDISEQETSIIKQSIENQAFDQPSLPTSIEDMANGSLQNAHDLSTETMARIHTRQENFDNALAIYQNLLEKFPEKADYYKQKIEEIKQRLLKP